jgi:hypothetical protein
MIAFTIVVALLCTFAVGFGLVTADVPKPPWAIGPTRADHPTAYWSIMAALTVVGGMAWLRVAGVL